MKKFLVLFLLVNLCTGCAHNYKFDNSAAVAENDKYKVSISMERTKMNATGTGLSAVAEELNAYDLKIVNYTDDDIEIDWTKTSFILNGQTNGGFIKDGELYINRDLPKNPTVVMPKSVQDIYIFPSMLINSYNQRLAMPDGKSGVYLVLKVKNKEYKEQLYITKTRE